MNDRKQRRYFHRKRDTTNPEPKKKVLAQVLDNAEDIKADLRLDSLDEEDWVEENRSELESACRSANFLLIVCGDRIQPRPARRIAALASHANPLHR